MSHAQPRTYSFRAQLGTDQRLKFGVVSLSCEIFSMGSSPWVCLLLVVRTIESDF